MNYCLVIILFYRRPLKAVHSHMIQTFTMKRTTMVATPWCMKNADGGQWEGSLRGTVGLTACPLALALVLTTCLQEEETTMTWVHAEALLRPREGAEGEPDPHATCQWGLLTIAEGEQAISQPEICGFSPSCPSNLCNDEFYLLKVAFIGYLVTSHWIHEVSCIDIE